MTPLLCPVWCRATAASFSSTSTRRERSRVTSSRAVARPRIPAPMTTTSNIGAPRTVTPLGMGELREARHQLLHALFGKGDRHLLVVVAQRARHDDALAERGMPHLVARPEPRIARHGPPLPPGPPGPLVGKAREHRVAAAGPAALAARAGPPPGALRPGGALLQLDPPAVVPALARQL